jgi:hypothetical protein
VYTSAFLERSFFATFLPASSDSLDPNLQTTATLLNFKRTLSILLHLKIIVSRWQNWDKQLSMN